MANEVVDVGVMYTAGLYKACFGSIGSDLLGRGFTDSKECNEGRALVDGVVLWLNLKL
jgi:hypothetical protein